MINKKSIQLFLFPIIFTILGLVTSIYMLINNNDKRWMSALCLVAIGCLPLILHLLKVRFPFSLQIVVYIFTFLALFLGICLYFYVTISWFDIFCHSVFGYIGALIALYFLCFAKERLPLFLFLFIISLVSMGFGAIWEVIEYVLALITGDDVQRVKDTGINDTMHDMICNLGGALAFVIHYLIDRFAFQKKLFALVEKDFSNNIK